MIADQVHPLRAINDQYQGKVPASYPSGCKWNFHLAKGVFSLRPDAHFAVARIFVTQSQRVIAIEQDFNIVGRLGLRRSPGMGKTR